METPRKSEPVNMEIPAEILTADTGMPAESQPVNIEIPAESLTADTETLAESQPVNMEIPQESLTTDTEMPAESKPVNIEIPTESLTADTETPAECQPVNVEIPTEGQPSLENVPDETVTSSTKSSPADDEIPAWERKICEHPLDINLSISYSRLTSPDVLTIFIFERVGAGQEAKHVTKTMTLNP